MTTPWPQPISPLHLLAASALVAALPLALLLVLMGVLRKSAYASAASALGAALLLALTVWRMPMGLALASAAFGFVYGLWPIMWVVFSALWLYNLASDAGSFELLRRWMRKHASANICVQAILVAFCFGALLEGTAGFGSPVAIAAFLLVALGFSARRAVTVALIANTTPVAFGALGIPVVALAGVTGLDLNKLSAMIGRQLPLLSVLLPAYLVLVLAGLKGLREAWPAALVGGATFALTQFVVSNFWGPYAADILASVASIAGLVLLLRFWRPMVAENSAVAEHEERALSSGEGFRAWLPWAVLSIVMMGWSYFKLFDKGSLKLAVPHLNHAVFITLYQKPYAAVYAFQPLAAGTGALLAVLITALLLGVPPRWLVNSGLRTAKQLAAPGLTVGLIVALAYLYNYSGMTYTLGAALASLGFFFPFASGYLGWLACFMTGSDTSSNLLFGNLQVAAAHQIGVSPILLAATNSSGAVMGKMISPQNICIGVTTVGLVGREGEVLRTTFWHSILLAGLLSTLALLQAHALAWMVP
ncbi:MAG TPA: L-lactate permease [Terriglobia bacterium]|nr:L-lactate permease [Terriglobia bacterium]